MASRIASPLEPEDNLLLPSRVHKQRDVRFHRRRLRVFGKKRRIIFEARNGQKNRVGKVAQWETARRLLKIRFRKAGITSCEAGFTHECTYDNFLSWAHSKKRADITGDEIYEVALVCAAAHQILEAMPKPKMRAAILAIIAGRAKQP